MRLASAFIMRLGIGTSFEPVTPGLFFHLSVKTDCKMTVVLAKRVGEV